MEFTINDFKLRYKNQFFGYLWSIVNPLIMLITLYVVFSFVMKLDVPNYQLFLLIGIIIWNYFSDATNTSLNNFRNHSALLHRHKISPHLLILSASLSTLVNLVVSFAIFLIMMIVFDVSFSFISFYSIYSIILLFLVSLGVSFFVSGLYFYFKDMIHVWSFSLFIGFWISPIIYSEQLLPANIRRIYMLNPIARIISQIRNVFIYGYLDSLEQIIITTLICLIVFVLGIWVFNKLSKDFVDKL